jgi:hypothetical protein
MERKIVRSKRPRPEAENAHSSSEKKQHNNKEEEEEGSDDVIITPHTLRLLKLIQEGSSEHAKMAAAHLKVVTSGSSPLVLWEVLGRLQFFLTSPEWRTRHNASMAMEGVAQHVPQQDQRRFLQESHKQAHANNDLWLTLADLKEGKMDTILQNGRHLMSSSETEYDKLEDEELDELDRAQKGSLEFCERRIQLQRQILATRLGLSDILNQVSGNDLQKTVRDLIPSNAKALQTGKEKKRKLPPKDIEKSVRALLVMEIKQQEGSDLVSHEKAQTILATELIYRMFDQSWYVRHGSLMGILALVRAWNVHRSTECFGIWPRDILARCLCVLALDRFGDFSGATHTEMSGGTVAPVREMAGQVFSVVFIMAPPSLQRDALDILQHLVKDEHWEVRHGALIALKYAVVLIENVLVSHDPWPQEFVKTGFMVAISRLEDSCDDVQSVAARLLDSVLSGKMESESDQRQMFRINDIVAPLWKSLEKVSLVSSSIKDMVSLFATLVGMNCSLVLGQISCGQGDWDSFRRILEGLDVLLTCEYLSVKKSIIRSTGAIAEHLASFCKTSDAEIDDSRRNMDESFCQIIKRIYNLYCYYSFFDGAGTTLERTTLSSVCHDLWTTIVRVSREILKHDVQKRLDVQSYLVLRYFDLDDRAIQQVKSTDRRRDSLKALSGRRLQIQTNIAEAISSFLMDAGKTSDRQHAPDMLELCLRAALDSPVTSNFESACILFHSLFGSNAHNWSSTSGMQSLKICCEQTLQKNLQTEPSCMLVERSKVLESDSGLADVLHNAFVCGIEMVKSRGASGEEAASAVVNLWKKRLQTIPMHDKNANVSVDSMRVSVSITGAVIAGGYQCFPEKLTPLVRSLMTSIQNEQNESCRAVTCSYTTELLDALSGAVPSDKVDAYKRTCGKVVVNLSNLVASQVPPGAVAASRVIGLLTEILSKERVIEVLEPIWDAIAPLKDCGAEATQDVRRALFLLQALCIGLKRGRTITAHVIKTYCESLSKLGCIAQDSGVRKASSSLTKKLCTLDESLTLSMALPGLVTLMKDNDNDSHRLRACQLVRDVLETSSMAICPFVRSLLPLAMSMMTDPVEQCARTAATIFSCLVQVAPVVSENTSIAIHGLDVDKKAELVMDHLIHGKTLPPCNLHPLIVESLNATNTVLRKYQLEGISWLRFLQTVNLNGALCDSMGLGKTLQALVGVGISHLDTEAGEEPISLIVCPSSVVGHWLGEIQRFFPNDKIFRPMALYGTEIQRKERWSAKMNDCNIVVTSYAVLRSDVARLETIKWRYCILDEGHLLKNPKTSKYESEAVDLSCRHSFLIDSSSSLVTARASRRLKSKHKLILTGTPVQNKVFEVWSTFDFLMPNFLGTSSSFSKEFARPITKGQSAGATALDVVTSMEKLRLLHQQVLPFILRREKEQVLPELPPKTITTILCEMSPLQARLYSNFCSGAAAKKSLDSLQRAIESTKKPDGDKNGFKLGSDVLKSFLYLRLLCTYPALVTTDAQRWIATDQDSLEFSGKLMALSELLRNAGIQSQTHKLTAADNDSSLLYCDDEDDTENNEVDEALDPDSVDSAMLSRDTSQTTPGSKCLIFAQFTRSLDVVEKLLLQRNMGSDVGYVRLDGRVPVEERSKIVDTFNNDESIRIMLLTTRIGGLGLNLTGTSGNGLDYLYYHSIRVLTLDRVTTGADTVILLEHDWNPHAE